MQAGGGPSDAVRPALADRLIPLRQGTVREVCRREDFAKLPVNTPWLYLYREKYPNQARKEDYYETLRDQ